MYQVRRFNSGTIIATRTKMPVDSIGADTVELKPAPPNFVVS